MALGILKDEATYYRDSEKYTGDSGTETNMYVIEDCYDFMTMIEGNDDYSYFKLVNDIDFNEHPIYKRGFGGYLPKNSTNCLYGDNHTIKNIVAIGQKYDLMVFYELVDCNFVNIIAIDCDYIPISASNAECCNFGMYLSNSKLYFRYGTNNYLTATDCTFNIKGIVSGFDFQEIIANQCHFNLDITINREYIFKQGAFSNTDRFINCYVTGKIKNLYDGAVTWKTGQFNPSNSYFAFEYEQPLAEAIEAKTNGINSFIDGDLFSKNGTTITSNTSSLKILTTEQAQSAEYLNSIGFLVIPVE